MSAQDHDAQITTMITTYPKMRHTNGAALPYQDSSIDYLVALFGFQGDLATCGVEVVAGENAVRIDIKEISLHQKDEDGRLSLVHRWDGGANADMAAQGMYAKVGKTFRGVRPNQTYQMQYVVEVSTTQSTASMHDSFERCYVG